MQENQYNQSSIIAQKQRAIKTMLHTDSLSSDPSDYQSLPNNYRSSDFQSTNQSSLKKRTSRPRKQPSLPNGGNTSAQQQQQLKQQLLQKILLKQNLKQHSLSSSDENLIDEFESKRASVYLHQGVENKVGVDHFTLKKIHASKNLVGVLKSMIYHLANNSMLDSNITIIT